MQRFVCSILDRSEGTFGLVYAWPMLSSWREWFLKVSLGWFLCEPRPPPMVVPTIQYYCTVWYEHWVHIQINHVVEDLKCWASELNTLSPLPSTTHSFFTPTISSLYFFSICLGWYYTTNTPSQHAGVTTTTTNISILIKLIIIIRIVVHLLVL